MTNPKIQVRHDTSTNWATANPILLEGEIGYETNTGKVKIGDGTTTYNNLQYNFDIDTSKFVDKDGDTMTGNLNTPAIITNNIYAKGATSKYISLNNDGITIEGDLITNQIKDQYGKTITTSTGTDLQIGNTSYSLKLASSYDNINVVKGDGTQDALAYQSQIPTNVSELTNDENYVNTTYINNNCVKLSGAQTVAGNKTFTGYTSIGSQKLPINFYNTTANTQYARVTFSGNDLQLNSTQGGFNLQCNTADDKIYKINSTATTTKYQVYTEEDKAAITSLAFPSPSLYTKLALPAANTNLTAIGDGYYGLVGEAAQSNQLCYAELTSYVDGKRTMGIRSIEAQPNAGMDVSVFLPVSKGQAVLIGYSNFTVSTQNYMGFYFVPAVGSKQ